MIRNLKNKIAWITGAGSGIGQDAAIKLSKLGMKVILSGRNIQTLQDTASKCDKDTIIKPVDISDKQSVRDLIYALKSEILKPREFLLSLCLSRGLPSLKRGHHVVGLYLDTFAKAPTLGPGLEIP